MPGLLSVKGRDIVLVGPGRMGVVMPHLPASNLATDLRIEHRYHDEEAVQGAPFITTLADGSKREGNTDAKGFAVLKDIPPGSVQVKFKPDARQRERIDREPNDAIGDALDDVLQRHAPAKKERS